jgi:hypothetical protein
MRPTTTTSCPPRKKNDNSAKGNPNLIPLPQSASEEGRPVNTAEPQKLDLEGTSSNWDCTDEEQYLADRIKGWS